MSPAPPDVLLVVGARPNFVKVAPVFHALTATGRTQVRLLHTGQHYDPVLSRAFLDQLGLPEPDYALGVGSGSHAEQVAGVLIGMERTLASDAFDAVVVAGDVNSTLAAALAAARAPTALVHVESGLRSGDWTMPEELNRVLTDRVSDLLLCHSEEALANLRGEGVDGERIRLVGNTMIDSLLRLLPEARRRGGPERLGLEPGGFALVTLHRPALTDRPAELLAVLTALDELARDLPVVFPLHPRTRARLAGLAPPLQGVRLIDPLPYLDFIALEAEARLVVTDSGGVQEETSVLGVPCLTYRTSTERPVTLRLGTNRLVGTDPEALRRAALDVLAAPPPPTPSIPLWDGAAGARAAQEIERLVGLA